MKIVLKRKQNLNNFEKIFSQRLAKNEDLSTITERTIKEVKQSKQLKLFAEKQSVEILFSPVVYSSRDKNQIKQIIMSERERERERLHNQFILYRLHLVF